MIAINAAGEMVRYTFKNDDIRYSCKSKPSYFDALETDDAMYVACLAADTYDLHIVQYSKRDL